MQKRVLIYDDSFKQELSGIIRYIAFDLHNPDAAERLSTMIQSAIKKRFQFPGFFEPYRPTKKLRFTYYRIYVGNYTIFYYFQGKEMHISHIFYSASDMNSKLK